MTEDKKETPPSTGRITEDERFKYVGFDVFPGRIKDMFKSQAERDKLVEKVRQKRENKGDLIALREECTLLEERVSLTDRVFLMIACVAMVAALFLPWYAAYNEVVEENQVEVAAEPGDSLAAMGDSLMADTSALTAATDETGGTTTEETTEGEGFSEGPREEVLHGYVARKKITRNYVRMSGIGSLAAIGSVGGYVFSSGFVVMLTGVILLIMTLASVALPAYTMYGLFGLKGNPDEQALKLKSILKLNWLPLICFTIALFASFVGGSYGFDAASMYHSLGDSYGPGAFLGSLSWGVFVSLAASIMLAVKGIEI